VHFSVEKLKISVKIHGEHNVKFPPKKVFLGVAFGIFTSNRKRLNIINNLKYFFAAFLRLVNRYVKELKSVMTARRDFLMAPFLKTYKIHKTCFQRRKYLVRPENP
jgi:hypothetical protein